MRNRSIPVDWTILWKPPRQRSGLSGISLDVLGGTAVGEFEGAYVADPEQSNFESLRVPGEKSHSLDAYIVATFSRDPIKQTSSICL